MTRQTHTYAELDVSERTWKEIETKLLAAGYQHAILRKDGSMGHDVIDMHGIGLVAIETKSRLLRLVGTDADDRLQAAADTVYHLAITHMTAGLRIANRLRVEAGQKAMTAEEILTLLDMTPEDPYGS